MSKKKKKEVVEEKDYVIISASVNDDFCNYVYEIKKGIGEGDTVTVKGKGIVDNDLIDALRKFNVHLACIDDVFKHSDLEISNIEKMENHELTALYFVTGFKIKGTGDNECIVLIGTKSINATGGRIALETPKIPLDKLSSYTWYNELKECADNARNEVDLYKQGKCTPVEKEEQVDPNQLKIEEEDFDEAKV